MGDRQLGRHEVEQAFERYRKARWVFDRLPHPESVGFLEPGHMVADDVGIDTAGPPEWLGGLPRDMSRWGWEILVGRHRHRDETFS
jgi:hypothetical protein